MGLLMDRGIRFVLLVCLTLALQNCAAGLRMPVVLAPTVEHLDETIRLDSVWSVKSSSLLRNLISLSDEQFLAISRRGEITVHSLTDGKRLSRRWQPDYRPLLAVLRDVPGNRILLAYHGRGEIKAYDLGLARILWKKRLDAVHAGGLVLGEDLVFRQGAGTLMRMAPGSGEVPLRRSVPGALTSGPVLSQGDLWCTTATGGLVRFTPELSQYETLLDSTLEPFPGLSASDTTLALVDSRGRVVLVDAVSGTPCWMVDLKHPIQAPAVFTARGLLVGQTDGSVDLLDLSDGHSIWMHSGPGLIREPALLLAGNVLVPYARGTIQMLDLSSGSSLQEITLPGVLQTWTSTESGLLVTTTNRNLLYYRILHE